MTANLLTEWCRLFVTSLRDAGVRDLVVSPGSRSTPVLVAAQRCEGLDLHVVRDERAAAFYALGLARGDDRVPALLCTSGTAPGHYLPAAMEARASGWPLVAVTADRPGELHGIAAPQTADQSHLFGDHAVGFFDLGAPDPHPAALAGLRRIAAQAVFSARWPTPGLVQVDLRARKPLEPQPPADAAAEALVAEVDRRLASPLVQAAPPVPMPDPLALDALAEVLARAARPLVVAGPMAEDEAPESLGALAERLGAPLLAEAASQWRDRGDPSVMWGYDVALRHPAAVDRLAPDAILQVGPPPTSAPLLRTLAAWTAPRWILASRGWADADNGAAGLVLGDVDAAVSGLQESLPKRPSSSRAAFRQAWTTAQAAAAVAIRATGGHGEGAACRAALAATPPDAALVLGNSLPIRHVETFCPPPGRGHPVTVQRGVMGIDGLVAGAIGLSVGRAAPVTLLVGDVSLLYDATSLELGQDLACSVAVVLLDNRGGRIFEMLPVAGPPADGRDVDMHDFTTPPNVDLEALARAYRVGYARAEDPDAVQAAVERAHNAPGLTLVHVVLPPSGAQADLAAVTARFSEAWS